MSIGADQLGALASFAEAVGMLRGGKLNGAWFNDPLGSGQAGVPGLSTILHSDAQREALVAFVDDVLGPPVRDNAADGDDRVVRVPLFRNDDDPAVTVLAVLRERPGVVHVGVGLEHDTALGAATATTRLTVPLFQVDREGAGTPASVEGLPDWLALGRPGARVEVGLDVTLSTAAPTPGQPHLAGATVELAVPTAAGDDLGVALTLRGLQLPGAAAARDFSVDADRLDVLDDELVELLTGLVQAQADALDPDDPDLAPFAALAGILGLRTTVPDLPPLPVAGLRTGGVAVVVAWVEQVLGDDDARDAWLAQLATLVGGTAQPARDAVAWSVGAGDVVLGLRVETGTAGRPVLVPWVSLELDTSDGADVAAHVDLLRADTGTGTVVAVPDVRAEARFGTAAGGAALLTGDPAAGGLRLGVALTASPSAPALRRPAFVLTLSDVVVAGRSHAVLDLSTPGAALDAASDVLAGALTRALQGFGDAGALVAVLLGLDPPVGQDGSDLEEIDAVALLADPLGELAGYWRRVLGDTTAAADVLGRLRALLAGGAPAAVPGTGTGTDPWRVELGTPLVLVAHREGDALVVALQVALTRAAGPGLEVHTRLEVGLARVELAARRLVAVPSATATVGLRAADGTPLRVPVGPAAVEAAALGASATWSAAGGLQLALDAPGLAVVLAGAGGAVGTGPARVPVPLPQLDPATGELLPPDWLAVEAALAALAACLGSPPLDLALDLLGWSGGSHARLSLAALVDDPAPAVADWVADLLLDCAAVRAVLEPVATVLSGGTRRGPDGAGSAARPFRCPVGGDARAPGLAVWLEPPCPPSRAALAGGDRLRTEPPEPDDLVAALASAAHVLPDVADLLAGRPGLASGLQLLLDRWTGTDGLVGLPESVPGVTRVVLPDVGYDELLALGRAGLLLADVLADGAVATDTVLHVGCEALWAAPDDASGGPPALVALDATGPDAPAPLSATAVGTWSLRVAPPAEAAAARPDLGAVPAQAAAVSAVLAARTAPVLLVGYGAAGAAVVRAASAAAAGVVAGVVVVGAPWGAPAHVDALRTGGGGDALALLDRLRRTGSEPWPAHLLALEATPLERCRRLVERCAAVAAGHADDAGLPDAGAQPRPDVPVHAVGGALSADALAVAVGALVLDGIEARFAAAAAVGRSDGPPESLHVGLDVPVTDLALGDVLVGAGVTVELLRVAEGTGGEGMAASAARGVVVDLALGVADGWLVGGPGALRRDLALRRLGVRVEVPLDGRVGSAELVLLDARAFGIDRERWVVRADDLDAPAGGVLEDGVRAFDAAVTPLLPEVRVLLSAVVARLRATPAAAPLADLLAALGLVRDGGLDPAALDRLFHDTVPLLRGGVAAAPGAVADALRALAGAGGNGSTVTWSLGTATLVLDLAAGTCAATVSTGGGPVPLTASVVAGPGGAVLSATAGSLDPHAGGLALQVAAATGPAEPPATAPTGSAVLAWAAPGGPARLVPLLPVPDPAAVLDLVTVLLPAAAAQAGLGALRLLARDVGAQPASLLDAALDGLDLLSDRASTGERAARLPLGLLGDPAAWLRTGATTWRDDHAGSAAALFDALGALVTPGRPEGVTGWPLADGLALRCTEVGGRLLLALDVTLDEDVDGVAVATTVTGGLLVSATGPPQPVLDATVTLDGTGPALTLAPAPRLSLVRPPAPPVALVPATGGLGATLAGAGESLVPVVLEALRGHADDAGTPPLRRVARAVDALTDALDLQHEGAVSAAQVRLFAADPVAWTLARLPALGARGLEALAAALDPDGDVVVASRPATATARLAFAAGLVLVVDGGSTPSVALSGVVDLPGVGPLRLDALRLSAAGASLAGALGPVVVSAGALVLRPLLVVRAGTGVEAGTRLLGLGLALDDDAARAVEVRWSLGTTPPQLLAVDRASTGETLLGPAEAAARLLALAASTAGSVLLDALGDDLPEDAVSGLQGVVLLDDGTGTSTDLDPGLFLDLLDPPALLGRLQRLAWNLATAPAPPSVTIDDVVTLALAAQDAGGGDKHLGVTVSLPPNRRLVLAPGETQVELEVDARWLPPEVPPGLSVLVLRGHVDADGTVALEVDAALLVAGLGLRVVQTSGPLLDLGGVSLAAVGISTYAEVSSAGVGGGVRLLLDGLAFAPSGGGGANAVANALLRDAGASASPSARPSLSPSVAVQKRPRTPLGVTLRAGEPPGPWWVVVQRQLGPVYVDRVGLDTAESKGTVSRITLLFDGSVSLFGLTAAVDQLSLSWSHGDVLELSSWAVDLRGLAVSADLAGISLAGGLLRTVDRTSGAVSYVGMLMGRFATYGLSVFGGYAEDRGHASFFVFGALNGPIGGPPAFFVTGLGGGLGINRGLRVPEDLSRFGEHPFIRALDPAAAPPADPMTALEELGRYFPPQAGQFWFAAGLSFTSFALVDGIAVVSVAFGQGLEINLLGLARMALPRPGAALVSIELGLLARFSSTEGLFLVRAQLTDNSWLLYEDVRLTGGFAFAVWWKGRLAGQFVLTLGGYHPDFRREGYPDVPRLGLTWRVSDAIVVKGGAYFALTSEALMAGVDISVSADFGFAWARLELGAHGIVYFDPFWFEVLAYARISAGVKIRTWLGTLSFSVSLGARVRVWGPDFSGEATLEVGPAEITVGFGTRREVEPRRLSWAEFAAKYLEDAGGGRARALSSITGRGTLPATSTDPRGAPSPDGTLERPFEVVAEFELTVVTTVPTTRFVVGAADVPVDVRSSNGLPSGLALAPLAQGALSSVLGLALHRWDDDARAWTEEATGLAALAANLVAGAPRPEGSTTGTDAFPVGAWGPLPLPDLPVKPLPQGEVVRAGNRVTLVAEATTTAVGPRMDYHRVESGRRPLPLRATGTLRADLLTAAAGVGLPSPTTAAEALSAASTALFAAPASGAGAAPVDLPAGVLATGRRSGVAAASFARERSAPPLFGSLADGLATAPGEAAAADRGPAAEPPAPRDRRAPFVAGLLAAGAGVAARPGGTTVTGRTGAGATRRRPAPATASVQARLGRSLPVQLRHTTAPGAVLEDTVVATGAVPATGAPGTTRAFLGGPAGLGADPEVAGFVSGLPTRAAHDGPAVRASTDSGRLLRPGDVVALQLPDAAHDVAPEPAARPVLAVEGKARVLALRGEGTVLLDLEAESTGSGPAEVPVPPGTSLLVVQADGDVDVADGLAGWHHRSSVLRCGSTVAVGAGCALSVDAGPGERGRSGGPTGSGAAGSSWGGLGAAAAGDLTGSASAVTTRFTRPVTTVAVVLEGGTAERLDPLALELTGAQVARGAGGELDPVVVLLGDTAVLAYAVEPDEDAQAVVVRVRAGGSWRLAGVLGSSGSTGDAAATARLFAERGVAGVAGRVLATTGAGARLAWRDPEEDLR